MPRGLTHVFMRESTGFILVACERGSIPPAAADSQGPRLRDVEYDATLVDRLRGGDEEAFVTLVGRYHEPMVRLARSLVSSQAVAEEAVQDTWLGVVRGISRFEGNSTLKTWLFRILVSRARSAGAREHRGERGGAGADVDGGPVEP